MKVTKPTVDVKLLPVKLGKRGSLFAELENPLIKQVPKSTKSLRNEAMLLNEFTLGSKNLVSSMLKPKSLLGGKGLSGLSLLNPSITTSRKSKISTKQFQNVKIVPMLKQDSATKTALKLDSFLKPSTRLTQKQAQRQGLITLQSLTSLRTLKPGKPLRPSPIVPEPGINLPPFLPYGGNKKRPRKRRAAPFTRKSKYMPSLTAIASGKKGKKLKYLTGTEERVIAI